MAKTRKTPLVRIEDLLGGRPLGHIRKPKYRDKKTGEWKESAFWWIEYGYQGKTYRISSKSTNHADAVALRNKIFAELWAGRLPIKAREITLGEALQAALTKARNKGRASIGAMELSAARLLGRPAVLKGKDGEPIKEKDLPEKLRQQRQRIAAVRLGSGERMRAAAVTETVIDVYVSARRAQGYAPATVDLDLSMLRRSLRIAHRSRDEHGLPLLRVVPTIELLRENNVREGFPDEAEFQAIRARLPPILQGLADFYRVTGYRKREPLRITIDMVDVGAGVIRLSPRVAKSRKWRSAWVYMKHPVLRAAIERQLELREQIQHARGVVIDHLFFWEDGRPIKSFRGSWKKAAAAAGYAHRLVHDFRRMAARDLRKAGLDPKTARELLGAKTNSIFERYSITTEEDEAAAVEMLAKYHESNPAGVPRVVPMEKKVDG